jgi:ankyrin repeat protein
VDQNKVAQLERRLDRSSSTSFLNKLTGLFKNDKTFAQKKQKQRVLALKECLATRDNQGDLILHKLIRRGQTNLAKKVATLSPTLNEMDSKGLTPVTIAVQNDSSNLAHDLVQEGADFFLAGNGAQSAFEISVLALNLDLVKTAWTLRHPGQEVQLLSIFSLLKNGDLLEAVAETEIF